MHPYLIHSGRFLLPTFGVLAAAGLMLALSLSLRTAQMVKISPDALWNAGLFAILSALVSSRLLLVAANLSSFLSYPLLVLALPSLTATGILLTVIATAIFLWAKQLPFLPTLDAWAPCATLTWAFLALGHLAEGSDPGLPSTHWFRILSPTGGAYLHPVALYVALVAASVTLLLLRLLKSHPVPGRTATLALGASGIAQFLLTFLRHPSTDDLPFNFPFGDVLDPIQWAALAMIVAACALFLIPFRTQPLPSSNRESQSHPLEHHAL